MPPTSKPSIVALIPARAGSKRIPGKNTKSLGGKPLLQLTIEVAHDSGMFDNIVVCADSHLAIDVGRISGYGDWLQYHKRDESGDEEPDVVWVRSIADDWGSSYDAFAILRPTSPFRTAQTIRDAWDYFLAHQPGDSLRAVRPVTEHPGKMWQVKGDVMHPIMPYRHKDGTPWHSSPTQTLRPIYVQTGGLEIAWTKTVRETQTISGDRVLAFHMPADECLDINTPADWAEAERIIEKNRHQPLEYLG